MAVSSVALLWAATAGAACPAPVPSTALAAHIDEAEASFAAHDPERFAEQSTAARADLECLAEALPRPTAADQHRLVGLAAFVARDADLAVRSFASARALEPAWTFPESLVPAGHPIRDDYASMDPASSPTAPVLPSRGGRVEIDGGTATTRPLDRPVVFQRFDASGAVVMTHWVAPGEALPAYDVRRPRDPATRPLAYGAAGAGVVGIGLLVGARLSLAGYDGIDAGTPAGQAALDPARNRTNALLGASAGAGGAAIAAGISALVVQRW
jgi:hypothetical protein